MLPEFLLTAFKFQEKPTQKKRNLLAKRVEIIEESTESQYDLLAKRVEIIEESTESQYEGDNSDVVDNGTTIDHGQDEDAYSAVEKKISRLID